MIGVHEDTDADGDADGSDVWFYPAYDEGWREVARYRESDSSPKEQFVNAMAGLDGYGGSSYINDVVCRNRDNTGGWLAASDGTLEERYYYCANWRGDHSALVTSDRKLHEMDKYSAYGVPFGLPGGDTNSDGDNDAADATQIQAWIDAAAYDVRGDVDLDGDVDSTDTTLAQGAPINGISLGWGSLANDAIRNLRGPFGSALHASLANSRRRELGLKQGAWLTRDPIGYADSINLYLAVKSNPLRFTDPTGTVATAKVCPLCMPGGGVQVSNDHSNLPPIAPSASRNLGGPCGITVNAYCSVREATEDGKGAGSCELRNGRCVHKRECELTCSITATSSCAGTWAWYEGEDAGAPTLDKPLIVSLNSNGSTGDFRMHVECGDTWVDTGVYTVGGVDLAFVVTTITCSDCPTPPE